MVYWPGVTTGGVCREAVSSIDFYPTITEMLGLKGEGNVNQEFDGVSLVPLLKQPAAELARDTLFWHYPHYYNTTSPVSSIREENWKLLEYFEDEHVELYNLADDPGEQRDLAGQLPQQAAELRERLAFWRESVDAQLPKLNSR
jgi:arylsulfatase A-like enzyme